VTLLLVGSGVAVAGWLVLVRVAIVFGRQAQTDPGGPGWARTVGAGAGAVLCLLLAFALAARVREAVAPRRRPGAHRH
jgi:hypothetical protein